MLQESERCSLVVSTQSKKTWQAGKVSGQLNGNLCRYSTGNQLDSSNSETPQNKDSTTP